MIPRKLISLLFLGAFIMMNPSFAQEPFKNLEELGADSSLFIGGSSVMLLKKGQVEINSSSTFNTFVLGLKQFREASPYVDRFRSTSFTSRVNTYFGTSSKGTLDVGFRVEYVRRRFDDEARSSPVDVFNEQNDEVNSTAVGNDRNNSFGGVSRVGIRFRLKPFSQNNKFTVLGGYSVGAIKSERFQKNLNATSDQLDLSMTYYHVLNPRSFYYVAVSGFFDPKNKVDIVSNYTLAGTIALINIGLNNRLTIYPGLSYIIGAEPSSEKSGQTGWVWTNRKFSGFIGIQVQFSRNFLLNTTFNMGITNQLSDPWFEIIPQSESTLNLSFRILI